LEAERLPWRAGFLSGAGRPYLLGLGFWRRCL